jgi:hypothetical protein
VVDRDFRVLFDHATLGGFQCFDEASVMDLSAALLVFGVPFGVLALGILAAAVHARSAPPITEAEKAASSGRRDAEEWAAKVVATAMERAVSEYTRRSAETAASGTSQMVSGMMASTEEAEDIGTVKHGRS